MSFIDFFFVEWCVFVKFFIDLLLIEEILNDFKFRLGNGNLVLIFDIFFK